MITNRIQTLTGWINSPELVSLAKPLAVLLVMVFSLTAHINASIAAGSGSILCLSTQTIDKQDGSNKSRRALIEHCSLCTISKDKIDFGLEYSNTLIARPNNLCDSDPVDCVLITNNFQPNNQIRAPPVS